ncbi:MAG: enoyl-CoA hydratase-related protein [Bacteroidota bacterium]|nr:enoyl-CoA hydratase-related protein [Bacteroidota bacterium]
MENFKLIKLHLEHPLLRITMNRPEKRNALSPEMMTEISAALESVAGDEDVRVIILTGEGNTFCAGADLEYMQKLSEFGAEENLADSRKLRDLLWKIYTFPKIVIAQVHGAALGGGAGLAAVCDMTFASDDSEFGYTEVGLGFIPALVCVFLTRKIGAQHARELLLSARKFSAEEAYSLGMINSVVSCPQLEDMVKSYALTVARNSPTAVAMTKRLLATTAGMSMEAALEYAASMNALARGTEDAKKGRAKFLAKK